MTYSDTSRFLLCANVLENKGAIDSLLPFISLYLTWGPGASTLACSFFNSRQSPALAM